VGGAAHAATSGGSITVYGKNKFPGDLRAVQNAVNNYNTVTLSGTFNFGDGHIEIFNDDVTLKGLPESRIIGGSNAPHSGIYGVINSYGSGVKILNLTMEKYTGSGQYFTGIISLSAPAGDPVVISGNTLSSLQADGIYACYNNCAVEILGNTVSSLAATILAFQNTAPLNITGNFVDTSIRVMENTAPININGNIAHTGIVTSIYCNGNTARLNIAGNTVTSYGDGILALFSDNFSPNPPLFHAPDPDATITIVNNDITITDYSESRPHGDGILVYGATCWDIPGSTCPGYPASAGPCMDWPDMPLCLIENNRVHCHGDPLNVNADGRGIGLGRSAQICSNATVRNNIVDGSPAWAPLITSSYGSNNLIENNDFSKAYSWSGIFTSGRSNIFRNNKFGPSVWDNVSVVWLNYHKHNWAELGLPGPTPDPLDVSGNVLIGNDYRMTGMPGFTDSSPGCIALYSICDSEDPACSWDALAFRSRNHNNLVDESGKFPVGTGGAASQVFDWGVNNRVVGLPANEVTQTGIGQRLKSIRKMANRESFARHTGPLKFTKLNKKILLPRG
jgi:hypothetical protein